MMRFLPVAIAEVMIWKKSYRFPHLPFQIAVELLVLPVVEERSVAIHLPVRLEEPVEEISKGGRSGDVRRF